MWNRRAAYAALLLCLGVAQAQSPKNCVAFPLEQPRLAGKLPAVVKFFADFELSADPSKPSQVQVVYSNLPPPIQAGFVDHLEAAHWSCGAVPPGALVKQLWSFVGARTGSQRTRFAESKLTLGRFLAHMKEVPGARVDLNLDEMGCPFVVEWQSFRPAAPNRARVVGAAAESRRDPLLRWLGSLEADVPEAMQAQLIGETMDISVPCGRVNLAPPGDAASSPG